MSIIEKEGRTVEQAIERGLRELGLSRDEVQVEIVSLGSSGFLGFIGARPAKVRLKIQPQPRIKRIVESILERMGFPGTVRAFSEEGGRLTAVIESEAGEKYLRANNGAALDALEYLVGKIYREAEQDIHFDIGGFRQSQGDHLKSMALEIARKVKESGQEQKLPPMPPHQRKVIHKALENHPDVRTFAVGEGDRRRVIIAPKNKPSKTKATTAEPAKHKPQAESKGKAAGRTGKREGRKPQSKAREQEKPEPARAAARMETAAVEPEPKPKSEEIGFVPRSKKKAKRP